MFFSKLVQEGMEWGEEAPQLQNTVYNSDMDSTIFVGRHLVQIEKSTEK